MSFSNFSKSYFVSILLVSPLKCPEYILDCTKLDNYHYLCASPPVKQVKFPRAPALLAVSRLTFSEPRAPCFALHKLIITIRDDLFIDDLHACQFSCSPFSHLISCLESSANSPQSA